MAKEKPRCVMCGQETEFFRRATLPLYNTNQIVCTDCKQRYESAGAAEQAKLKQQMIASPHLWDRERLQALLNWKKEEETTPKPAAVRMCCGQPMQELGSAKFLMGEHSALLDQLCASSGGGIVLAVRRCERCGQVRFFDPKALK